MSNLLTQFLIGLGIFVLFLILVGHYSSRKTKSTADFAVAGRSLSPLIVAATMIATYGSASSYLGNPGLAYAYGWPMAWIWVGCVIGIVIPTLFLGPRMRMISTRLNTLTIPDFLGKVYESKLLHLIASIGIIVFYTPMMIAQFKGVDILFNTFFGGKYSWSLTLLAVILIIYSSRGGLVTVAWTDAAQFILMALIMLAIVPTSIYLTGGWSAMNEKLTAIDSSLTAIFDPVMFTPMTVFFMMIYYSLWQIGQPYMATRLFAIDDYKNFKKVVIYIIIFTVIIGLGMWAGFAGRILLPGVDVPDSIMPLFISTYFPTYFSAFAVIAILAAVLTTITSILHAIGTTIGYDIIKNLNIKLTDKQSLRASQIGTFLIGSIALIASLFQTPEFLALLVYGALGGMGSIVVGPIFMAMIDKKATKEGAILASLLGCGLFITLLIYEYNVWIAGAIGMSASILGTFILSRIFGTASSNLQQVHQVFASLSSKTLETPQSDSDRVEKAN